jgi:GrpB-like predicted nucleotidyltransferase (UPF0157 family)
LAKIVIVDYEPAWPRLFETLKAHIWTAVADVAVTIEHVGSTAVPGLAAKPVIDMDVVVPETAVAIGIARLATLDYRHLGDLGIPGREAFRSPPDAPPHHLYLCPSTSPSLASHLAFRDHLRAHPSEVQAYADLKKRLAVEFADDVAAYGEGKTSFVLGILRECGFPSDALAQIEEMNRR